MDSIEFNKIAEHTLEKLTRDIEQADQEYLLEIDRIGPVLTIELEDGREYIINKHDASQEIWVASPVSGASHFHHQEGVWKNRQGEILENMLAKELKQLVDITLY